MKLLILTLKAADQISLMIKSDKNQSLSDNDTVKEILNFFNQISNVNTPIKNEEKIQSVEIENNVS